MSHLGARVAGLVDGQLPPAEAEALYAHVAACPRCERLLVQERQSRAALAGARDVRPDPALTARLLSLSLGPTHPPAPPRWRRTRWVALSAGSLALVVVVGLVLVGGISEPRADPRAILGAVTGASGQRPAGLPAVEEVSTDEVVAWMEEEGWSAPRSLPPGMRVVGVELHDAEDGQILELEIAGAMAHVRLLQQRGVLDAAPELRTQLAGPSGAVPLPSGAADIAVQSRDCVVLVLAASDDGPASEQIAQALPEGGYDTSVGARLGRGWRALTDWSQD